MSNILEVFNPPDGSKPQAPKSDKQCVPCLLTSSAVMILGGSYMASGQIFSSTKENPLPKAATPAWRNTVRAGGIGVILFGIMRGIEGIMVGMGEKFD
ncbi:hypothetical protein TRICI_001575 [Trichomonascus ciferrii]|uniref:DUF4536 domain-containing protein n=1 Tax=Trichomonascus ciferrii TaxID=44093 RepID=A0A642V946_9ASCO|nr:hypothetical protein TRICI_001575 [Trichomonascus ciferrii]